MAASLTIRVNYVKWLMAGLTVLGAVYVSLAWYGVKEPSLEDALKDLSASAQEPHGASDAVIFEKNVLGLEMPQKKKKRKPKTAAAPPPPPPPPAPPSPAFDPTTWKVVGVFVGERAAAIALIDNKSEVVFLGDMVKGWILSKVTFDNTRWVSDGQTRDVAVTFDRLKEGMYPKVAAPPTGASWDGTMTPVARDVAEDFLTNPRRLMSHARFKPARIQGQDVGFWVNNIHENSILKRIGLKNMDVLLRVNGSTVKDQQSLIQAYANLPQQKYIALDILRDGAEKTIVVELM